jgi:opacity protein-like surface antigen
VLASLLVGGLLATAPAAAWDAEGTFTRNAVILSGEGGYGEQYNLEGFRDDTGLTLANAGLRLGWLPFGAAGPGPLFGALELGLEPFYQRYLEPVHAFFGGLAAVGRYHFLTLGRFVPYLELAGAAGGTDLRVREIDSDFTFLLWGGVGASLFVTDRAAVYAGYRYQHVSNGNVDPPNRGFEAHTGVVGVSYFFP